jgi:hypothetical protein
MFFFSFLNQLILKNQAQEVGNWQTVTTKNKSLHTITIAVLSRKNAERVSSRNRGANKA